MKCSMTTEPTEVWNGMLEMVEKEHRHQMTILKLE
jgi:hypothetical protein